MKFIFDLDGTVTAAETLPIISNHFNIGKEIKELTEETVKGNIPFVESFIKRVMILGKLPVSDINQLLSKTPLTDNIVKFINENKNDCIIATGNFIGWIQKLVDKIECKSYSSEGIIENNNIKKLTKILKKEDIVKRYKAQGEKVVFIGDGNNDVEAMREADISIACGIVHKPAKSVLAVVDYAVYDKYALIRLLNQIKTDQLGLSVVLSCAGIGSRLGLGQTKALVNILGKPLIYWQMEQLNKVDDIRVVIGFQASQVTETVLRLRKDVIFIYNHNYFNTKTGTSFYLGAKHANEFVIAWDGDLLVHPNDIEKCLQTTEYVGCSKSITDDAVLVEIDEDKNVISFSREIGQFEWSGPACLKKENIKYVSGHVYTQIENVLPLPALIINAQDIDTYDDYKKAVDFIKTW